jgi:hypothetical protein
MAWTNTLKAQPITTTIFTTTSVKASSNAGCSDPEPVTIVGFYDKARNLLSIITIFYFNIQLPFSFAHGITLRSISKFNIYVNG